MTTISSQKNWLTAIRITKNMDPIYLEVEKTGSQLFRARKTVLQLFVERKKWIPAISSPKKVFHNSLEQGKRG